MLEEKTKKVYDGFMFHLIHHCVIRSKGGDIIRKCPYYLNDHCNKTLFSDAVDLIVAQAERIHGLEQLVLEARKNEWEPLEE